MSEWYRLSDSLPIAVSKEADETKGLVSYVPPPWADFDPKDVVDMHFGPYSLDVISNGTLLHNVELNDRAFHLLGCMDSCELVYKNPLVSRRHAVFQLTRHGALLLFDLNSKHGTTVNYKQVEPGTYYLLKAGDQVRIAQRGSTSRTYVVCSANEEENAQQETDEAERPKKKVRQSAEKDEQEIMEAVKKASAADYYDTNLYFDEWDNYFDRTEVKREKTKKQEQKTHTAASLRRELRKLYKEEVDIINRWYKVLASAIESAGACEKETLSKADKQLKVIQCKALKDDRNRLQSELDGIEGAIAKHRKLLKLTMA